MRRIFLRLFAQVIYYHPKVLRLLAAVRAPHGLQRPLMGKRLPLLNAPGLFESTKLLDGYAGRIEQTAEYCNGWAGMVVGTEGRNMVSASAACKRRSVP